MNTPLQRRLLGAAAATFGVVLALPPVTAGADPFCTAINAPALQIAEVECKQVLPKLQASGMFPDVFAGAGKALGLCYASTGPAAASIGNFPVTIASTLSAWSHDFVPVLFGGTDNLGTVVTELTITDVRGRFPAQLFTRDTIDLSQILTTGTASEEDVIVGGSEYLFAAKGTYRLASAPANPPSVAVINLTGLTGVICLGP